VPFEARTFLGHPGARGQAGSRDPVVLHKFTRGVRGFAVNQSCPASSRRNTPREGCYEGLWSEPPSSAPSTPSGASPPCPGRRPGHACRTAPPRVQKTTPLIPHRYFLMARSMGWKVSCAKNNHTLSFIGLGIVSESRARCQSYAPLPIAS